MEKRLIRMLHVNCVWELHVNLDYFTFHTVSQRKLSKFYLKIPARESQHILQWNLSQIHLYHGLKRPKKKTKSNLWEVCFSSAAVVSKLLLGCSGHFLFILCHCNPLAHSVMCTIHMQLQRTAWNVGFHTFLATFHTISYTNTTWNLSMEQRLIRMLHVNAEPNAAWEPHINLDSLIFHPVSQRKWSKFHLKIAARESQHCL